MTRLTKADVERLLDGYDADPVGALTVALRRVHDTEGEWPELVAAAVGDPGRRRSLLDRDVGALDDLARELNELRGLDRPASTHTPTRGRASR